MLLGFSGHPPDFRKYSRVQCHDPDGVGCALVLVLIVGARRTAGIVAILQDFIDCWAALLHKFHAHPSCLLRRPDEVFCAEIIGQMHQNL